MIELELGVRLTLLLGLFGAAWLIDAIANYRRRRDGEE